MKVLVLGGSGMLGHKVVQTFSSRFDTWATIRREPDPSSLDLYEGVRLITGVDAQDLDGIASAIREVAPDAVVNCIGVVKQAAAAKDPVATITVNSLFPHQLANLCAEDGARLIHISTDCVFSGDRGCYREDDVPDPVDLYGRSKLLGEPVGREALTIRTSIIGRELDSSQGLLEWFLSQEGQTVRGFTRAIFSGFPTRALAQHLAYLVESAPGLSGLRHLASEPISKYDLLCLVKEIYDLEIEIEADDTLACDRSLDGRCLREETGIRPQPWRELIEAMFHDPTEYTELRAAVAC